MGDPLSPEIDDFVNVDRGFIAALEPGVIKTPDGRAVWDSDAYAFLSAECPDTANPSLWRQGRLCARQGLYEVTEGIYQVRGLDISNMTLTEGDRGVIVIDPLICVETAAAALGLYRAHRGDRPVTGVIYTHSHGDHFGGVAGVTDGDVPILAPVGFMEHAVSENVYAGTAMTRRAMYMYGATLPPGPAVQIGMGLGIAASTGTVSLFPPSVDITRTGQEETVDGVRMVFQLTPGTEAPAEMNFFFPQRRALCMAENASHTLHNILTLRGAVVRDARIWSRYLSEAISLFGAETDVVFASHHWPTWGNSTILRYLSEQRDVYAYLHDQTLRMLNQGHTGVEIAEMIQLPPVLEQAWHARGYYGSVSHNVKAIYQRYLGWFDGNPASFWQHPPVETAKRYVACFGGVEQVVAKAHDFVESGDMRFAVQLLQHAVFADPDDDAAKQLLAQVYERLGHSAGNGTWRNFYLTGAQELRTGITVTPVDLGTGMAAALSIEQIFDTVAIRVNAPAAWQETITIDWVLEDGPYRTTLRHGVLIHHPAGDSAQPDLTLRLTKTQLLGLLAGQGLNGISHEGDPDALKRLLSHLDSPDPNFAIVTP